VGSGQPTEHRKPGGVLTAHSPPLRTGPEVLVYRAAYMSPEGGRYTQVTPRAPSYRNSVRRARGTTHAEVLT
jgi:hypothetical protein